MAMVLTSRGVRLRGLWIDLIAAALAAIALSACGATTRPIAVTTVPAVRSLPCHGPAGRVVWRPDGQPDQPTLDRWCGSVGAPIVNVADQAPAQVRRLLVLSWNVGVGAGRLAALVDLLRARAPKPASGEVGLVVLLQEAFRGGPDVPEDVPAGVDAPGAIRPDRPTPDIVEVARALGMSLVYVPSMRNGAAASRYEREDRGNAILSTEPLTDVTAFELPFAKQRRVAVAATVTVRGSGTKLRVVAAHLDTPGRGTIGQARELAEFIASAKGDVPLVLGIDTNALLGRSGAIVGQLEKVLPLSPSCTRGRTGPWPFGRLDFVFTNLPDATTTCETLTDGYGSDHVPVLLTVDW
jgi:endonuclease/exonuclease/phosphatase family metal-dependent hydrolase